MTKRLYFFVGIVFGLLFAEIVRRKQMQRLQSLEAQEARRKATNARYEKEWQRELATLPFDERMDYELWEASMKHDNWMPEEGDDEEETD